MKPQVVRHQQSQMVLLGQTLSFETQQIPQAWILAQTQMPAGSRGTGWKFSARKGLEHWWRLHCPWQTSSNDHQNCCPNSSGCPQRMQRTRVSFKTKLLGTKTRIFWSSEPWWSCLNNGRFLENLQKSISQTRILGRNTHRKDSQKRCTTVSAVSNC